MSEGDGGADKTKARPAQSFKVTDRRHFTSEGERRLEDTGEAEEETSKPSPAPPAAEAQGARGPEFERRPLNEPESVDFTMLINAMAQPALLFLGEISHPGTGKPTIDPEQAKLQIDMLELLRVKCRGNLTRQEENLLEQVLYHLRMLYVSRAPQSP